MSVYLSKSPYYLNSYRAGSARKVRKNRPAHRNASRLWDSGSSLSDPRRLRSSKPSIFAAFQKKTKMGAQRTSQVVKKSAETFSEVARSVTNIPKKKASFELGSSTIIAGLTGFAILLGLGYLAHFNQVATKGYDLKRLEADRQQLLSQYEIKNMRLAEIQSLTTIIESEKADSMRRPFSVEYVRGNNVLAAR